MIKKFFIMCSGVDTAILQNCSVGTQTKYVGIGATVFFTAVMAFIASSYALFTVFENYYTSLFFGLIWGLLIFNLDRFIVSTIKKSDTKWKEVWQATPRIILAIIIAIVISKPLELKIFEKEINQQLLVKKNELTQVNKDQIAQLFSSDLKKLTTEITQLKQEISSKEKETNALYNNYISEAEGTAGTKLLGKGPVYKEKREKHDAALVDLQQLKTKNLLKIEEKEAQITTLYKSRNNAIDSSQPIIDTYDGLMARIHALSNLPLLPSLFIFLLFLAIETSPIIAKLIAQRDEYDLKQTDAEDAVKDWLLQKKMQRTNLQETETSLNNEIYSELKTDDELYAYKKKLAKQMLQFQADSFYNSQQKTVDYSSNG